MKPPPKNGPRLPIRGIVYDTGTNYVPNALTREVWHESGTERDMQMIKRELGCNAVMLFGTRLDRLRRTALYALRCGLQVWLQPRLIDGSQEAVLDHLIEVARLAEGLSEGRPGRVVLNIGCELSLFMEGVLPGAHFHERIDNLMRRRTQDGSFNDVLNRFLRQACGEVRVHFKGPVVYAAGEWEAVDWRPFDYVGVDYYMNEHNETGYVRGLRALQKLGKPLIITEFGCCTFAGAEKAGGAGFMIITDDVEPRIKPGYERDEGVQARYLERLITIYKREGVDGSFVYGFSEPGNLRSDDPSADLDMASYGVVAVLKAASEHKPEVWEPKRAFSKLAQLYNAAYITSRD